MVKRISLTMYATLVALAATLVFCVSAKSRFRGAAVPVGSACASSTFCEEGSECLDLDGRKTCLPIQDFSGISPVGLFGRCNQNTKCAVRMECRSGICQFASKEVRTCVVNNVPWMNPCGNFLAYHMTCQNGQCKYGFPGSPCRTTWRTRRCLPGLRCVGAPGADANEPGVCRRIKEGDRCLFGAECPLGLICGTRGKCVRSAEGQYCQSSFWCPIDHVCENFSCVYGGKVGWDKVPTEGRARTCRTELDCPIEDNLNLEFRTQCLNGVCLPRLLEKACTTQTDCEYGSACDVQQGKCVEATRGKACGNRLGCYYGMNCDFRTKTCATRGIGRNCQTFSMCPQGIGCKNSKCVLGSRGDFCYSHSQCKIGLFCVDQACKNVADIIPS